ncbi:TetR/AcrR family transcriptional regulator, partial [Pseudomonas putida]|uniref:TetR/AcrR family transcriptional regulator n=1 Tax=Pseudomonas putida TaxID=303 RepID=UPI002751A1DD
MSGLRERQMEMRRQAIADAAIELFRDQGYAETTIEQIAKLAGVSSPTVFKYYGSKQEILLGLLEEADRRAVLDLRGVMHEFEDPVDVL